jgi:hypothetical protein
VLGTKAKIGSGGQLVGVEKNTTGRFPDIRSTLLVRACLANRCRIQGDRFKGTTSIGCIRLRGINPNDSDFAVARVQWVIESVGMTGSTEGSIGIHDLREI